MSFENKLGKDIYQSILLSACTNVGNPAPIKKAFSKDKIHIAFIGGSVTYGYFPDGTPCSEGYAYELERKLKKTFSHKTFSFINLGISGTACLMGAFLSEYKLREFSPDIVFVEYALNEESSPVGIEHYESLLRKLMTFESAPAIIPVSAINRDGYSCEEFTNELAKHYDLYSVGLKKALSPIFAESLLEWADYSCDEGHPLPDGHILIADCILSLLDVALKSNSDKAFTVKDKMFSSRFENLKIINLPHNLKQNCENFFSFDNSAELNKTVEFKLEFQNLAFVFVQSNKEEYTDCEIKIDGKNAGILQGYSIFGWDNPVVSLAYKSEIPAVHTVTITPQNKSKRFILCAVGIC